MTPAPAVSVSMCPATTTEPRAAPGRAPPTHQPSVPGFSGRFSAPLASVPTGTTRARACNDGASKATGGRTSGGSGAADLGRVVGRAERGGSRGRAAAGGATQSTVAAAPTGASAGTVPTSATSARAGCVSRYAPPARQTAAPSARTAASPPRPTGGEPAPPQPPGPRP